MYLGSLLLIADPNDGDFASSVRFHSVLDNSIVINEHPLGFSASA